LCRRSYHRRPPATGHGTLHNAIADYGPDEQRLMKRCQVMADRILDPPFLQAALSAAPRAARQMLASGPDQ